ncbi:MAG: molybdopterin-synthase adenylyltransferase MoeB [Myxococcota bacterium]|nr:molybdopterin-synthase adenylyltransferase MoeB [Myxococcota bacterium]
MATLTNEEIQRYSRHLILEEVGMAGQEKLKESAVLCVGTGGLGSPLLLYLAAAGVGRIGIVDFDVVDTSNLQRQVIHGSATVGKKKVDSAKERILDINPHIQVDLFDVALTSENAIELFEPYDVIVDGTDNFPTRYLVNDACVLTGKPNVYGSIFKFEGQATVFNYGDGPNYRDLYPEPPPPGLVPSCAEGGVLGILPGVIGCIQATETIKILLGVGTTLSGRLLTYDALNMRFKEFKLRRDPEAKPITGLIDYQQFCGVPANDHEEQAAAGPAVVDISAPQLVERLKTNHLQLIDVREPHEWDICRIDGAKLIPLGQIENRISELDPEQEVIVYCKMGGRSKKAYNLLRNKGFTDLRNLKGGIRAWSEEVDPNIPTY